MKCISRTLSLFIPSILSLFLAFGCASSMPSDEVPREISVEQTQGTAYWVLPGPRELSPAVFGTREDPKRLMRPRMRIAKGTVPKLLKGLPLLVGLPEDGPWGRTYKDGRGFLEHGSPFGDNMKPLPPEKDNYFRATFYDNQLEDTGETIDDTDDDVDLETKFYDPQGNSYEIEIEKVFQPPIPGWNTEGGVLVNSFIGGTTGTFIPLLPTAYSHATFWAFGRISVNGRKPVVRVTVLYVTETIRDENGHLALDEEMPLNSKGVQAHLLVPPIKPISDKGLVKKPVPTAYELPPEAPRKHQPFICIYFPNPTITSGQQYVR